MLTVGAVKRLEFGSALTMAASIPYFVKLYGVEHDVAYQDFACSRGELGFQAARRFHP